MSAPPDTLNQAYGPHTEAAQPTSLERMRLTRARLRHALLPPPEAPVDEPSGLSALLNRFRKQPSISIIVDALTGWWSHHPMRPLAHLAKDAANAVAKPIAQHNPLALIAAAGVFGILLAWSRPWRWALKSALFAGLMPQLISRVAANLPLESWLAALAPATSAPAAPTETHRSSS